MFKGKPILGAITGFMFGLFLGPTLWLWGLIPFHSPLIWILPLVGIVLGLVMAAWAPFGKSDTAEATGATEPSSSQADSGDVAMTDGDTDA